MKTYLLFIAFICISLSSLAQTSGDYRSAGTGDWNVTGSWEMYNGTIWIAAPAPPSSTDGVITILSPHTITANSAIVADQVIIASGATLDKSSSNFTLVDGPGTDLMVNGTLAVSSNISGAGTAIVNGTMNWSGGSISNSTTLSALGIINATQGSKSIGGTMTINGTMNITGNGINNGGGTLINNGTLNKTVVESAQADMNVDWSNAGTINILAGELSNNTPYPSRSFTNTGTINISPGAVFSNTGYYIHGGGAMTGSGTFNQAGGFLTLDAALTVPASLTFNYTGGNTNGAGTLTATNLNFSGGNIGGTGGLTLNGTTTWTGGGFLRNFAIAAGDIINAKQGSKSIGGTMTINGTMNITGNGITDAGTLINNGIINKTVVESAQADMIVNWTNAGTINILAGELSNSTPYPSRSYQYRNY